MFKRKLMIMLVIVFFVTAASASYAVPQDPSGAVMDITHFVPSFWQGGYSNAYANYVTKTLGGWGCNILGSHAVYSPSTGSCNPNANWDGPTIGKSGCAITSLTMLFWYHGITSVPPNLPPVTTPDYQGPLDPGKLNDWMVDNKAYFGPNSNDVLWEASTLRFSNTVDWLTVIGSPDLGYSLRQSLIILWHQTIAAMTIARLKMLLVSTRVWEVEISLNFWIRIQRTITRT